MSLLGKKLRTLFRKPAAPASPYYEQDLGDGYTIRSVEKANGLGGYHPADMALWRNGKQLRQITGADGTFCSFPGVVHGDWEKQQTYPFQPCVRFTARVGKFLDEKAVFSWMLQPDGRYYADDDGFGWEDDEEIMLYALINRRGEFVTPFSSEVPEGRRA